MVIKGFATAEGTASAAERFRPLQYEMLGGTGLMCSPAGFGCYRVGIGIRGHEAALRKALLGGINLIDTSANYADGDSEKLVGHVLNDLLASGELAREMIIVVSKVGYLQGQNYTLSQERKHMGNPLEELVLYGEGLEHCIHPGFLENQLTRSLNRLQLETLDFYLLHNPEYYLGWAEKSGISRGDAHREYYRRIRNAFHYLEEEVQRGRIRAYGISSNTFPNPSGDFGFTALDRVWAAAESISPDHHFRIIQLPMNLFEAGGVLGVNQTGGKTVLQMALEQHIGVLINRPLNAFVRNRLVRLADVGAREKVGQTDIDDRIEALRQAEMRLFMLPAPASQGIKDRIAVGETLHAHWRSFGSYEAWQEIRATYFLPRIRGVLEYLKTHPPGDSALPGGTADYRDSVDTALGAVSSFYAAAARQRADAVEAAVSASDPDWDHPGTLSQLALRAVRSTPGVSCVLVGMRHIDYVDDVLTELARPVRKRERAGAWRRLQDQLKAVST